MTALCFRYSLAQSRPLRLCAQGETIVLQHAPQCALGWACMRCMKCLMPARPVGPGGKRELDSHMVAIDFTVLCFPQPWLLQSAAAIQCWCSANAPGFDTIPCHCQRVSYAAGQASGCMAGALLRAADMLLQMAADGQPSLLHVLIIWASVAI